jgi:hypothetical protein
MTDVVDESEVKAKQNPQIKIQNTLENYKRVFEIWSCVKQPTGRHFLKSVTFESFLFSNKGVSTKSKA